MGKLKIGIVTAIHGRHETVRIFAANTKLPVLAVCSSSADGELAASLGMKVLYKDNQPLSNKWNAGAAAVKGYDWGAVIFLGSDDVLTIRAEKSIRTALQDHDFAGFENIILWDRIKKEGRHWPGYTNHRKGEPAGAGRAITISALEKLNYQPWQPGINKSLDFTFWEKVKASNLKVKMLNTEDHGLLIDIKDTESMTPLERFAECPSIDLKPLYRQARLKYKGWV